MNLSHIILVKLILNVELTIKLSIKYIFSEFKNKKIMIMLPTALLVILMLTASKNLYKTHLPLMP